jgi:hypothetical protein
MCLGFSHFWSRGALQKFPGRLPEHHPTLSGQSAAANREHRIEKRVSSCGGLVTMRLGDALGNLGVL